ncbi:hypothetical protein CC78DRAFT_607570 [Lojkania enalia]|uniref:Uncharacterized protein n=1 Tax=Lojkania enalia TaxID=147567 RepID=A0A9P4K3S7_9PLEO|nr:hypothetical protein CC78DRAFT_607570 [Didymosphaeria enalia]
MKLFSVALLPLSHLSVASLLEYRQYQLCYPDDCLDAANVTAGTSDCAAFMTTTLLIDPITTKTTTTVYDNACPASSSDSGFPIATDSFHIARLRRDSLPNVAASDISITYGTIPSYATSACASIGYFSACSCLGVSPALCRSTSITVTETCIVRVTDSCGTTGSTATTVASSSNPSSTVNITLTFGSSTSTTSIILTSNDPLTGSGSGTGTATGTTSGSFETSSETTGTPTSTRIIESSTGLPTGISTTSSLGTGTGTGSDVATTLSISSCSRQQHLPPYENTTHSDFCTGPSTDFNITATATSIDFNTTATATSFNGTTMTTLAPATSVLPTEPPSNITSSTEALSNTTSPTLAYSTTLTPILPTNATTLGPNTTTSAPTSNLSPTGPLSNITSTTIISPTPTCSAGVAPELCSGQCVDLARDTSNCGQCGNQCAPENQCTNGVCIRPPCDSRCGSLRRCGDANSSCICGLESGMGGLCFNARGFCDEFDACEDTAECPVGTVCITQTCCGHGLCLSPVGCGVDGSSDVLSPPFKRIVKVDAKDFLGGRRRLDGSFGWE